ncbi:MAG: YihY/virulence factor BrkB family protein [Pseudomonadota bacterium]|nr:YihY/virulence factor BrkB family protein [Pseudomonadota bacterium]
MSDTTHHSPRNLAFSGREWFAILKRVWTRFNENRLTLIAAGVAFFALLSLFPAITATIALAGLVFQPAEITEPLQEFAAALPDGAADIIIDQATSVTGSDEGGLGLAAILGIVLALYSASKGVENLMVGLNIAYAEKDERGFIKSKLTVFGLTLFLILGVIIALGVMVVVPVVLNFLPIGGAVETLVRVVPWFVLLFFTIGAFSILFRFGPDRRSARWVYIVPGAVLACLLWIAASVGFSIYADNFGSYQESFGTLAGAIVLLMWLWISALVILLGAELNAEIEAQHLLDTTVGRDLPRGQRDAVKADEFAGRL